MKTPSAVSMSDMPAANRIASDVTASVGTSPGNYHRRAFGAPGRSPTLVGRDFRMAPTHRGGALASVTDHYHRQLLSGDHLHHGLLGFP
jgi:hypothetical protein